MGHSKNTNNSFIIDTSNKSFDNNIQFSQGAINDARNSNQYNQITTQEEDEQEDFN